MCPWGDGRAPAAHGSTTRNQSTGAHHGGRQAVDAQALLDPFRRQRLQVVRVLIEGARIVHKHAHLRAGVAPAGCSVAWLAVQHATSAWLARGWQQADAPQGQRNDIRRCAGRGPSSGRRGGRRDAALCMPCQHPCPSPQHPPAGPPWRPKCAPSPPALPTAGPLGTCASSRRAAPPAQPRSAPAAPGSAQPEGCSRLQKVVRRGGRRRHKGGQAGGCEGCPPDLTPALEQLVQIPRGCPPPRSAPIRSPFWASRWLSALPMPSVAPVTTAQAPKEHGSTGGRTK